MREEHKGMLPESIKLSGDAKSYANAVALGYATPDADGLPDVMPDVDAAIDRGDSIRRIAKRFAKRRQMPGYVARFFRRRFNVISATSRCVVCESQTDMLVTVHWSYQAASSFVAFHISDKAIRASLTTEHPLCITCLNHWNSRVSWASRMRRWATYLALSVFALPIVGLLMTRLMGRNDDWLLLAYLTVSLAVLLFGGVGTLGVRRGVPVALKRLVPRWLMCDGWVDFVRRDERLSRGER